jgi:light-regulated signal transduction histidine kinase (bacteriophytochrome)
MSQLIDDLLLLAHAAREALEPTDVDVTALANAVASDLRLANPQHAVEVDVEPGMVASGDARLLRVLFANLIGNASKFTACVSAPRIGVGTETVDGARAFFVRDNGAGFDMAYTSRLFAPFVRLHSASEFDGSGVGLATVRRVVARHGGRVWAEGSPGKGATLRFTLSAVKST